MLEIVGVDKSTDKMRETFFKLIFGNKNGLLCIAFIDRLGKKKDYSEVFFNYPADLPNVLTSIKNSLDKQLEVYFCPHLFLEKKRTKENVAYTHCAWADLDYCDPENLLIEPSVVIESSPERYQAYWIFKENCDPDDAENISQRIAYKHADEGADRSGWDLTQLLRVPLTYNYKYDNSPIVKIIKANRNEYTLKEFDEEYEETGSYLRIPFEIPENIGSYNVEELLQSQRMTLNPLIFGLFSQTPTDESWSEVLWKLLVLLFEAGYNREQVYAIASDAACNKYARDGRPAHQLWKDVCRAEAKFNKHSAFRDVPNDKLITLLDDKERALVQTFKPTFIERYIKWASNQTDAPSTYHQAGAVIALSSMLCGAVRLPTSYGNIIPNIWFMILADTTLTRKTTAMDLAMDVITEVDDNIVLATDGSIEGLLTTLSTRPGQPSIFLRDEFSGLLEQISKKDYMSGMAEFLTKLYDAKMQRRVLRNATVEVRQPRLIVFAGGIKDSVTALLTHEQVASGFIPRFVFITAESDISKVRPIGPPTIVSTVDRDKIVDELQTMYNWYNKTEEIFIEKLKTTMVQKVIFDAEMTEAGWFRYNQLESHLMLESQSSMFPTTMTPVFDRLCKSILKTAILIAASRQFNSEHKVFIDEADLLLAMKYGEEWIKHSQIITRNVGKGQDEYLLERIMAKVNKDGIEGTSRSTIMRNFRLDSRRASLIFDTLEQRGLVTRRKVGKAEFLVAPS